jgi:hypothetical protein
VLAKPRLERLEPIQAEIVEVTPSRSEIVPAARLGRFVEPDWFREEFPQDAAVVPWRERDAESRAYYQRMHSQVAANRARLATAEFRAPEASDAALLWSQYHFLKAMATRLDAGIATERELAAFKAGLQEYNVNYDRIAQRKALPS